MGGVPPAVDFLRPAADERPRRALFVIPIQTGHPCSVEFSSSRRNQNTARALVLPGPERAFDHDHASVLPHSSGAGLDFLASTPILAGLARQTSPTGGPNSTKMTEPVVQIGAFRFLAR